MEELYCAACEEPLLTMPVFNGDSPDFPPSFLFCQNPECSRAGLLSVSFKTKVIKKKKKVVLRGKKKKKIVKSKRKAV